MILSSNAGFCPKSSLTTVIVVVIVEEGSCGGIVVYWVWIIIKRVSALFTLIAILNCSGIIQIQDVTLI